MQRGIHETLDGERHVVGRERSAIGEVHAMAKLEGDLPAVRRHFPGFGQLGLEFLRVTIDADENASGEIADGERGVVIDEQWIESLGLGAEAEAEFAAVLREGREAEEKRNARQSINEMNLVRRPIMRSPPHWIRAVEMT